MIGELAWLVVPASLAVSLGLTWHFSWQIATAVTSRVLGWLLETYTLNPGRYAGYVELARQAMTPYLGRLLPLMGPLLGGMMGENSMSVGRRVGDYIAVEYKYRDTVYVALHPYSSGPEIRQVMMTAGDGEWCDVTSRVRRYAGPCGDFHGQRVRPADLVRDCRELVIRYSDEVVVNTLEEEVIDISGVYHRCVCRRATTSA